MKAMSKTCYYVMPIMASVVTAALVAFVLPHPMIREAYERKFQVPLFAGFLTIGGFLLSLKTFIVVKMNEAVYQSEKYLKATNTLQLLDPNFDPLSGLKNLGGFLLFCVKWSLTASFFQLSVGLFNYRFTTAICIGMAVGAACLVLSACFLIQENMKVMFEHWDEDRKTKQQKFNDNAA